MNRKSFIAKAGLLAAGIIFPVDRLFGRPAFRDEKPLWPELLSYARWCPSPHNVQPWKMKIISPAEAYLYYDPRRIPVIVDADTSFTIVGMGMFIECLNIAAQATGYQVTAQHETEPQLNSKPGGPHLFARLKLEPFPGKALIDRELILKRRTSRLHYDGGLIPANTIHELQQTASASGHHLTITSDAALIDSIIRLNTDTILERADDAPTMAEMRQWIRTSEKEAAEKKDGLWSRANATSGNLMHNFFYHHRRFTHGWKRGMTRSMLNKSMNGTSQLAWIKGPFEHRTDWVNAGVMLQRLWLDMTRHELYLHPLGTIITTTAAKEVFLKKTNENDQEGTIWFLVRMGYSKEPPRSFRLEEHDILIT